MAWAACGGLVGRARARNVLPETVVRLGNEIAALQRSADDAERVRGAAPPPVPHTRQSAPPRAHEHGANTSPALASKKIPRGGGCPQRHAAALASAQATAAATLTAAQDDATRRVAEARAERQDSALRAPVRARTLTLPASALAGWGPDRARQRGGVGTSPARGQRPCSARTQRRCAVARSATPRPRARGLTRARRR